MFPGPVQPVQARPVVGMGLLRGVLRGSAYWLVYLRHCGSYGYWFPGLYVVLVGAVVSDQDMRWKTRLWFAIGAVLFIYSLLAWDLTQAERVIMVGIANVMVALSGLPYLLRRDG